MPYYLERRGSRYKLRLRDDPQHEFSKKWLTKKEAMAQMQAIEISKKQRRQQRKRNVDSIDIEGGNFFSNVFAKVKNGFNSIINKVSPKAQTIIDTLSAPAQMIIDKVDEKTNYIDSVKDILAKYGNFGIVSMTVERQPVEDKIMFLANKITNGALRDLMIKHNIDAYYHLALRVDVIDDDGRILPFRIEKNENISIKPYTTRADSQYMNVGIGEDKLTMNILLTRTRLAIGEDHFYLYRFDSWNCADFIMEILRANDLLTPQLETFIYQNTDIIQKGIPQRIRNRMHKITKLASRIGHLRGRGFDDDGFRFL